MDWEIVDDLSLSSSYPACSSIPSPYNLSWHNMALALAAGSCFAFAAAAPRLLLRSFLFLFLCTHCTCCCLPACTCTFSPLVALPQICSWWRVALGEQNNDEIVERCHHSLIIGLQAPSRLICWNRDLDSLPSCTLPREVSIIIISRSVQSPTHLHRTPIYIKTKDQSKQPS